MTSLLARRNSASGEPSTTVTSEARAGVTVAPALPLPDDAVHVEPVSEGGRPRPRRGSPGRRLRSDRHLLLESAAVAAWSHPDSRFVAGARGGRPETGRRWRSGESGQRPASCVIGRRRWRRGRDRFQAAPVAGGPGPRGRGRRQGSAAATGRTAGRARAEDGRRSRHRQKRAELCRRGGRYRRRQRAGGSDQAGRRDAPRAPARWRGWAASALCST